MTELQKFQQAATVILLRPVEPEGFEAFLTRRPQGMAFLGGMYCFPGGAVRREDSSPKMLQRCYGLSADDARKIIGAYFSPAQALGLWVAGIRELFETVGIVLAIEETGEAFALNSKRQAVLAKRHCDPFEASLSFPTLLERERLCCDVSKLIYFSHWQTPVRSETPFDTHFFLAALPEDQTPLPTSREGTHSLWVTPDRALQLFTYGKLPMTFPTFASLRTLADFDSLEDVVREYTARRAVKAKPSSKFSK